MFLFYLWENYSISQNRKDKQMYEMTQYELLIEKLEDEAREEMRREYEDYED